MILVIDCGLSSVKVALVTEDGRIVESERESYPTRRSGGVSEQSPGDWWTALRAAMARLADRQRVTLIVPTGHMHATVLVDHRGEPVLPCLTLHDRRGEDLLGDLDADAFQAATGQWLDASLPFAKLRWLAAESPSSLSRAAALLAPKDYLRLLLCGHRATDPIDAAGTGLFDPVRRQWSPHAVDWAGIPPALLPRVHAPARAAGALSQDAATALGMPAGAAVLMGAGDDIELLGAGAYEPQAVVEHVGTTAALMRATRHPIELPTATVELSPSAMPDRHVLSTSLTNLGSVFDWITGGLGLQPADVLASEPHPGDPLAVARLLPERVRQEGHRDGASITHIEAHHTRVDLARAMLSSVAIALKSRLEDVENVSGAVQELYTSGGAQDRNWLALRAAAYERPVITLRDDATTLGCVAVALSARPGAGDLATIAHAIRRRGERVEPAPRLTAVMGTLRARLREAEELLDSGVPDRLPLPR